MDLIVCRNNSSSKTYKSQEQNLIGHYSINLTTIKLETDGFIEDYLCR